MPSHTLKRKLNMFLWPSSFGQRPLQLPSVHCYSASAVLHKPHTYSRCAPQAMPSQPAWHISAKTMQGSKIKCPWHLCLCVTPQSALRKRRIQHCILHTMDLQHHKIIHMANKTWLVNSILLLMKSNTICTVFKSMQGGWDIVDVIIISCIHNKKWRSL